MSTEFLVSTVCLLTAIFGLLILSELGFVAGNAEQASFFAARSEFVGLRGERSADRFLGNAPNDLTVETTPDGRIVRLRVEHRTLLPFSGVVFTEEKGSAEIEGRTGVPRRGVH